VWHFHIHLLHLKIKNTMKKKIFRIVLLVGTLISLFFVPWILVWAWILPLPNTVQEQVDEAINHGFDGMIVYVDEAKKPAAFYTGGWKDRKKKIPADPKSLFKIASISKLYTAVAITKLAKDNYLSLDDTLTDYFPELVDRIENAEKITLKLMVQHRLLRKIMDKVLSYSHEQYIKQKILLPLELNNTFFSLSEVNIDDVMSGYYVGIEQDFKTNENGMLATAEDVGIFLRALNDGSVFNEGEKEIYSSIYEYEHGGLVIGYQSLAEYHEDIDTVVVQFINTTDFNGYEWNLSEITINRIVKIIKKK